MSHRIMWLLWRTPVVKQRLWELWKAGYDMGVVVAEFRAERGRAVS